LQRLDGVAAAAADPENMMIFLRPAAGRSSFVHGALAVLLLLLTPAAGWAAGEFPFDQELLLDVAPKRPVKRVPILTVEPNGNATIELWCKTVRARVQLSDSAIRIDAGALPDALPAMMSDGQCSPERMQADADTLAALVQVSAWRWRGGAVLLVGPATLRFRPSDH
jgi:heat shock protein HslJ